MPRWRYQWSIDFYTGASLTALAPIRAGAPPRPALTARDATDIVGNTVADPFLLIVGLQWYLFFEIWNVATGRGEIAYATSADGVAWTYQQVVLREPFHLSYPHVFEWNGDVYMIPESRGGPDTCLYVATDFPRGWVRLATLLRGPFVDTTIVRHADRWWLFSHRGLDELRLYSSPALEHGWTEHPRSPLWAGDRHVTRPAGRVLRDNGRMIRLAQDGWPAYGASVRALEILQLSERHYEERELAESPILRASGSGWNSAAMHHLDAVRRADGSWLAAVDGATLVSD